MTDEELIARQAKQLEELRDEVADLKRRIHSAEMIMICTPGPLNGNLLGYTAEQRVTFHKINEALENGY